MKILDLTTDMIIDFTGSAKLADETLEFVDNRGVRYRRDDEVVGIESGREVQGGVWVPVRSVDGYGKRHFREGVSGQGEFHLCP